MLQSIILIYCPDSQRSHKLGFATYAQQTLLEMVVDECENKYMFMQPPSKKKNKLFAIKPKISEDFRPIE